MLVTVVFRSSRSLWSCSKSEANVVWTSHFKRVRSACWEGQSVGTAPPTRSGLGELRAEVPAH